MRVTFDDKLIKDRMPNTYTQIHLQLVFAVKFRAAVIEPHWKNELYKYITGIITTQGHKLISINGVADHVHILIGFKTHQSLSELLQDIKGSSSKWINDRKLTRSKFAWQSGYGAFSYSHSDLPRVIRYIENQEAHHKKIEFVSEYKAFLDAYEIAYDERYLLNAPE